MWWCGCACGGHTPVGRWLLRGIFFRNSVEARRGSFVTSVCGDDEWTVVPLLVGEELFGQLLEDIELLDELGSELDLQAVHDGELTPVFFGSGMNNFGVQLFLAG